VPAWDQANQYIGSGIKKGNPRIRFGFGDFYFGGEALAVFSATKRKAKEDYNENDKDNFDRVWIGVGKHDFFSGANPITGEK
jgi:hypothetical protein